MVAHLTIGREQLLEDQEQPQVDDYVLQFERTKSKATEELERLKIEDCRKQCLICLGEILRGSEAIRMPCSHNNHESRIVNWLETSNLCGLCQFATDAPAESS
ncbi:hypothetical protein ACFX13_039825 [Malus domestica]|uniref:E3 ubiquitin-protein ligase SIRP1-like n=1 Tax=Malus domestica TaxID=3750 RepID=UPI003976E3C3